MTTQNTNGQEVNIQQAENSNRLAFVLMPFDTEFSKIYTDLIKPTLEAEGFRVERADSTLDQQNILRTIVHNIDLADLVIAELTTSNPNVFYELGIAHGLSKPVILLAQDLKEVPFDLRSYTIVTYSLRFDEAHKLQERLSAIACALKEGSISFGSPVRDFAPSVTKTSTSIDIRPAQVETEEPSTETVESEEAGVLDFVSEVEASIEQIGEIVTSFGEMIEDFGRRIDELTAEVETPSGKTSGNTVQMRRVSKRFAGEIQNLGENIQTELPDFHTAWKRMEENFTRLLSVVSIESAEDREQAIELLGQLQEFEASIDPGLEGVQEARDAFASNTGLSREMNVAIRRTVKVLDTLIEELSTGQSYLTRMTNLLDQKIPNIGLTQPEEGSIISDPVHVSGSGRAFEGYINVRIKDDTGAIIAENNVIGGTGKILPFGIDLPFAQQPRTETGAIEAYTPSPKDGSELDLVSVSVKFSTSA
jgi:hypothetical protein